MGPGGLDAYLRANGSFASAELDRVCAQKDAHTALLYWFTDLDAAVAEARRTKRPILSLRLLGRLDEELSCANSRFFRTLLYPDPRVNGILREQFVLHWQSMRPVPRVTIDFGDGRKIERTITGNSVHLVLDMYRRPVDALPGLVDAATFAQLLAGAHALALADRATLPALHARAMRRPPPPPRVHRAVAASMIAPSKHVLEMPMLRAVMPDDTAGNIALHMRVHQAFASGASAWSIDELVEWIYRELFLMPMNDPALGLDAPDPFLPPLPTLPLLRS
jgi:hypothetical protein